MSSHSFETIWICVFLYAAEGVSPDMVKEGGAEELSGGACLSMFGKGTYLVGTGKMDLNEPSLVVLATHQGTAHQVKLILQGLLGAPRFLCHPTKGSGTKEAGGLFDTISSQRVSAKREVSLKWVHRREPLCQLVSPTGYWKTDQYLLHKMIGNLGTLLELMYTKSVW